MKSVIKSKKGFTLVEIMVAIAIVAILASVVLVSMTSYRAKARSAKALASLSSAIPSMISCFGNGGTPNSFSSGADICSIGSSYGKWPTISGDLSTYDENGSSFSGSADWHVYIDSGSSDDDARICCNSAMNSCKKDVSGSTCNVTTPGY